MLINFCNYQHGRSFIFHFLFSCTLILSISIIPSACASARARAPAPAPLSTPPELVKHVCQNTTIYDFCLKTLLSYPQIESLSSVPQSKQRTVVAEVAFELAFNVSRDTLAYIFSLAKTTPDDALLECETLYELIEDDMAWAYQTLGDQDPSTFDFYPNDSMGIVNDCEKQFKGRQHNPLHSRNLHLKLILEIGIAVTNVSA